MGIKTALFQRQSHIRRGNLPAVEHHALRGIGSGQLDGIACLGRGDLCAVGIGGGAIGQAHPVVAFLDLCGQGNAPLIVAVQGQVKCSGIAHLLGDCFFIARVGSDFPAGPGGRICFHVQGLVAHNAHHAGDAVGSAVVQGDPADLYILCIKVCATAENTTVRSASCGNGNAGIRQRYLSGSVGKAAHEDTAVRNVIVVNSIVKSTVFNRAVVADFYVEGAAINNAAFFVGQYIFQVILIIKDAAFDFAEVIYCPVNLCIAKVNRTVFINSQGFVFAVKEPAVQIAALVEFARINGNLLAIYNTNFKVNGFHDRLNGHITGTGAVFRQGNGQNVCSRIFDNGCVASFAQIPFDECGRCRFDRELPGHNILITDDINLAVELNICWYSITCNNRNDFAALCGKGLIVADLNLRGIRNIAYDAALQDALPHIYFTIDNAAIKLCTSTAPLTFIGKISVNISAGNNSAASGLAVTVICSTSLNFSEVSTFYYTS